MNDAAFPADFFWGAATSAYQIEGSPLADGAGPSNWHEFVRQPGATVNGDTGDVACDHYRRYREDVELMQQLDLNAYRFSFNWSRILPEGRGRLNPAGLDFYRRLIDCLLNAGIQPFATLYHWDLPLALERQGGWTQRDCAAWFAEYAHILFRELGGQVKHWATLNEPWVVVDAGYLHGVHAPGRRSVADAAQAVHNLLRGHALAVQAFRADSHGGQIGIVVNLAPKYAASADPADRAAMNRAHTYMNRLYLDPLLLGAYPDEVQDIFGRHWPAIDPADMRLLLEPIDFIGVNYYSRQVLRDAPDALPPFTAEVQQAGAEYTDMDWEVFPEGLTRTLLWLKQRYGNPPLYITENGAAFSDPAPVNGRIVDTQRIDYLHSHLLAARSAIQQGVNLKGYFVWSLLDNLEWGLGFSKRFGLIRVDPNTQDRTLKDSAYFYRDVIAQRGSGL